MGNSLNCASGNSAGRSSSKYKSNMTEKKDCKYTIVPILFVSCALKLIISNTGSDVLSMMVVREIPRLSCATLGVLLGFIVLCLVLECAGEGGERCRKGRRKCQGVNMESV
ncbi:hypothetical protein EB796_003554 [Bugula neritina]|uniref:Uncharacterized protein n=1 Tax=Bugula neritina TaxID=10212 RepID=A0A7J7KJV3_BUGNE|nr:hypothetical protein EB796_003554 [Bugula neritina]